MVGRRKNVTMTIVKVIAIVIFSLFFIIPLWLVITASITDSVTFIRDGYSFLPKNVSFKAFAYIFSNPLVVRGLINSTIATVSVTLLSVLVNTSAAYVLHEKNLPGHKLLNTIVVFTMFFNTGMIPIVLVIRAIGMYNSPMVIVIPAVLNVYNILLIRNYFYSLPPSLKEAPMIDGASQFQIFVKVMVPVSTPIIATTALMAFVTKWNSYMDILYYVNKDNTSLWTIQFVVQEMLADFKAFSSDDGVMSKGVVQSATIIITILPLMILFPLLQKYFVDGMTLGAVKG
ncbi:MAG: carbohydrate ABC transporter permease [Clostridia bacterium]|nr:carbohydrate ABC transporter permease [Clostridia bacterium]